MIKAIMHGACGHMGHVIADIAKSDDGIEIVAGIDPFDDGKCEFPVFSSIGECDVSADVVIDFSSAKAVDGLLSFCGEKNLPVVLCTTGLSEDQIKLVDRTEKMIDLLLKN